MEEANTEQKGLAEPQRPNRVEIGKFLDLQSREIDFKFRELELREKEMDLSAQHALKALEAQLKDRNTDAECYKQDSRQSYFLSALALVVIGAMFWYALYSGNKDVVVEVVKLAGVALGGGGVGFYIGWKKSNERGDGE